MKERFFGPWRIELVDVINVFESRILITGSSNADGAYEIDQNQPFMITVDGKDWTLGIESWWPPDAGFSSRPIRRSNSFDRINGLVAVIEMGKPPSGEIGPLYDYVHLRCISQDPNVNPAPAPDPFDFTLPER